MIWFIDDYDQTQIYITDLWREYKVPKFRLSMTVDEPYLTINYNNEEQGPGGKQRTLEINYLDVVDNYSGYISNPSSAEDLKLQIEAMVVSGWTNIAVGDLLNSKGQLLTHDGVSDVIHAPGSDRTLLGYDASTSDGLKNYTTSQVLSDAGGVVGPGSAVDDNIATFDGITGKIIQDSGVAISTDGTMAANSNAKIPTEQAVRTYVGAQIGSKSSYIIAFTGTVSSTNTASEEILWQYGIPANTLAAGDVVEVFAMWRKNSGAGAVNSKVYLNSANTVGGAGATNYIFGTGTTTGINEVNILFPTTTSQVGGPPNITPFGNFGNAPATGTLNTNAIIYVQVTSQKATGTDGFDLRAAFIKIHKYRT